MIDDNHLRTGWQVLHMLFKRSPQNNGAVLCTDGKPTRGVELQAGTNGTQ